MTMLPRADIPIDRRQVFRIGGLTVSFAALVAACGEDRTGDTAPGRVGYAPPVTSPPDYDVNDVVLLRTASSLEYSAIAVYEQVLGLGVLDAETTALVEELIANHQDIADEMGELTESAGGDAWECPNPWFMERLIEPVVALIVDSDDQVRDVFNTAVGLENLAASTHQSLAVQLTEPDAKLATMAAAVLESRHSAALVVRVRGAEGYISPGYRRRGRAPRRVRHPAALRRDGPFRQRRPGRADRRRRRRERRPRDVPAADPGRELLRLQRTRTHLLSVAGRRTLTPAMVRWPGDRGGACCTVEESRDSTGQGAGESQVGAT
jgi:hypothetical protein